MALTIAMSTHGCPTAPRVTTQGSPMALTTAMSTHGCPTAPTGSTQGCPMALIIAMSTHGCPTAPTPRVSSQGWCPQPHLYPVKEGTYFWKMALKRPGLTASVESGCQRAAMTSAKAAGTVGRQHGGYVRDYISWEGGVGGLHPPSVSSCGLRGPGGCSCRKSFRRQKSLRGLVLLRHCSTAFIKHCGDSKGTR